ncbi:hypothetical protein QYF36_002360 [Acer negundo]|nr:hypothetical protein QYF36_002360 [Acer negundo]
MAILRHDYIFVGAGNCSNMYGKGKRSRGLGCCWTTTYDTVGNELMNLLDSKSEAMQEAGACLQTFLDIMGGRVSPTTLFVLAIEIRAIADPCQRVAMAQNDWLRDQLSKLKSKVARREPRKTYMLSDIDSSYLVG